MTLDDITLVFKYKKVRLPIFYKQTRSHDPDASRAIQDCFLAYGYSSLELQNSETSVMTLLRSYLQFKRPHTGYEPGDSVPTKKRRHVKRRRRSDELINPSIASITVNSQDEFENPAAGSILDYTINNSCNIKQGLPSQY